MYTHKHTQSNVGHHLGYVEKKSLFLAAVLPSQKREACDLQSPQFLDLFSLLLVLQLRMGQWLSGGRLLFLYISLQAVHVN